MNALRQVMQSLQERFAALQARERLAVLLAALAIVGFVGHSLIWEPVRKAHLRATEAHAQAAENLQWMADAAATLKAHAGTNAPSPSPAQPGSPMVAAEQAARQFGLATALKRREPEGTDGVRLTLEGASFDALVRALDQLEKRHGLRVTQADIERQESAGLVNARLTLVRP